MSHPRTKFACAGLLAVALFSSGHAAQEPVTFRYKYVEGEQLRYLMDLKMTMTVKVMDMEVEVAGTMKMTMTLHTRAVGQDGKAKVMMRFNRIHANRQRIVRSGGCFFRHRITALNVCEHRQRPRG